MRLASGVAWRCWDDGCVVFCAATAQTLLLTPEFGAALRAVAEPDARPADRAALDTHADRLIDLGILEGEPEA